ncbi:uncharacterized protein LALA0_S06e00628g [Lachancea lanzarotensis]|uniref:LALA0S06e00628g1_1 n=1 Tax=Lachancea lanzarotensis TaxID=1245769 RepID=A0A0C7MRU9_9SACH|nr:uncharacterized protein LALA0_S06e00628g [Lachancea lanzarotensis]CEP62654.1 LALA0S06e00628g1_1 [Lachancea lanzarotensis]
MVLDSTFRKRELGYSQLPVELFSSKFSWRLHDIAKARYFYVWLFSLAIFPMVAAILVLKTNTWSSMVTRYIVIFSGELAFGSLPLACQVKKLKSISKLRSLLVKEVVRLGPDLNYDDWNLIAQHANEYLLQEGFWHSEHCIYDGAECLSYFRAQVYLPSINNPSENHDELLATELYEKSYEDYWNSQECVKFTTVQETNQTLPKDTYHFSLVYDLILGAKEALAFLPLVMLFFLLLVSKINLTMLVTYSVLWYLQLLASFCFLTRMSRKHVIFTPMNVMRLLKLELQLEPGESAREWDEVAKKMNTYLKDEGVFQGKRVFFDGKECHAKFQSLLAATLPEDDTKKSLYPELVCFASEFRTA